MLFSGRQICEESNLHLPFKYCSVTHFQQAGSSPHLRHRINVVMILFHSHYFVW
nr:hypothetical protein Iba_chr05dCG16160 [Ipomoea batatas]